MNPIEVCSIALIFSFVANFKVSRNEPARGSGGMLPTRALQAGTLINVCGARRPRDDCPALADKGECE
jgi:hypothetical protein